MANNRYQPRVQKGPAHNLNDRIRHPEVRVIGNDPRTGEKLESVVVSSSEALRMANSLGVDLVEISPDANPPVCRIVAYDKFLYELKQKEKTMKKKQVQCETKELRFTPQTDDNDVNFKTRHAIEWLKNGDKVRAVVVYKARQIKYKEQGELLLASLAVSLEEFGKVEQLPKLEGFKMTMVVAPKPKK